MPASQSFDHLRKCRLCSHDIPRNWVRLGCSRGCSESVCYNLNCAAKVLESAKQELTRRSPTSAQLEAILLEEESLLIREAAVDSLRERGNPMRSAAPALEKLLLHEISHSKDRHAAYGSSSTRDSIRHTYLANDGTHPLKEYPGWRALRVKAAVVLASMGEMRILEDTLLGHDPDAASRSEVREACMLAIAELGVQGRGAEAGHLVERLGRGLFDEVETVRIAAAHALRCVAPAGVANPALPYLLEAVKEENSATGPDHLGATPIRRWQDKEGRHLFELDVVAALGTLGEVDVSVAQHLETKLLRTKESSSMRWATAGALAESGGVDHLRRAAKHSSSVRPTDILHPRVKPQSASLTQEIRRAAEISLEGISAN